MVQFSGMINEIEPAQTYMFESLTDGGEPIIIGGKMLMNELAKNLEDDDIYGQAGMTPVKCILFVKFTRLECIDLIKKATESLDKILREELNEQEDLKTD